MRRVPGLIVAVLVLLAFAGCGGTSEEDRLKETVDGFASALEDEDGEAACALMTERAKQRFDELAEEAAADNCAEILTIVTQNDASLADDWTGITNIQISGSNGTAVIGKTSVTLIKEGGTWKIDTEPGI